MIEPIMYVGIGFLVAGLLVIGLIPMVHARAVRLTQRRLEALTPMSMAEIQADKDQLRAEFAMSTRRLEMSVEQMKAKTTSQMAEIGKKSEAVGRLKLELGEKTAALFALEAREKILQDDLQSTAQQLESKANKLQETERVLADISAELARVAAGSNDVSLMADSQRVELIALRAHAEVLKGQVESYENETKDLHERLERESTDRSNSHHLLAEERIKTEHLGYRIAELELQLVSQTTEAEILGRRVHELVTRTEEQGRFLAEREYDADLLRKQLTVGQQTEAEVRSSLVETESRYQLSTDTLRAEKVLAEGQLKNAQEDRDKLLHELAAMKREAEKAWAAERMENAVLRERINDVAAEVARMTSVLEGPSSPIEAILASEPERPHAGSNGNASNGTGEDVLGAIATPAESAKSTLADRIRALQSRTSRLPQAS
jgi:chromosome segregation ATPase